MPDKPSKKKLEIPQPRPDTIPLDDNDIAGFSAQEDLLSPAPPSEINPQAFQGRCPDHEEF